MAFKKKMSGVLASSLLFLSCNYTRLQYSFPQEISFFQQQISSDGKLIFRQSPECISLEGSIDSKAVKETCSGVVEIYNHHPEHGKVMILRASYGPIEFCAYDGALDNTFDGNPDRLEWRFRGSDRWNTYDVPDGTTPEHWPANIVHRNSKKLEEELRSYIRDEFWYEIHFEPPKEK